MWNENIILFNWKFELLSEVFIDSQKSSKIKNKSKYLESDSANCRTFFTIHKVFLVEVFKANIIKFLAKLKNKIKPDVQQKIFLLWTSFYWYAFLYL